MFEDKGVKQLCLPRSHSAGIYYDKQVSSCFYLVMTAVLYSIVLVRDLFYSWYNVLDGIKFPGDRDVVQFVL